MLYNMMTHVILDNMMTHVILDNMMTHLSVGDKPLERVHSIRLLGVHMTDTLKWDDHVKHLAS